MDDLPDIPLGLPAKAKSKPPKKLARVAGPAGEDFPDIPVTVGLSATAKSERPSKLARVAGPAGENFPEIPVTDGLPAKAKSEYPKKLARVAEPAGEDFPDIPVTVGVSASKQSPTRLRAGSKIHCQKKPVLKRLKSKKKTRDHVQPFRRLPAEALPRWGSILREAAANCTVSVEALSALPHDCACRCTWGGHDSRLPPLCHQMLDGPSLVCSISDGRPGWHS